MTNAKQKTKTIISYSDAGHGWAKVKKSELAQLGLKHLITGYSYQRGEYAYLEEDCDLSTYCKALDALGYKLTFKTHHTNKASKIRSYNSYYGGMSVEMIKEVIDAGTHRVYWKCNSYEVTKDSLGQYLITYAPNGSSIGLTWADGTTLNGNEEDFFKVKLGIAN